MPTGVNRREVAPAAGPGAAPGALRKVTCLGTAGTGTALDRVTALRVLGRWAAVAVPPEMAGVRTAATARVAAPAARPRLMGRVITVPPRESDGPRDYWRLQISV